MSNHTVDCKYCGADLRSWKYWHCPTVEYHENRCLENPKNKEEQKEDVK